jgi:predicted  nucleic acid-binding Zn-ribbon protein
LIDLQAVDMRIVELSNQRDALPIRRAEVAAEITALENEKQTLEDGVERARLDRRNREGELEIQQRQREKYETQLNDVKTNVAYSALLTEIQSAKRMIGELENEILELMDAIERDTSRLAEIEVELTEKREAARDELESIDSESAALEQQLATEEHRRNLVAETVEDHLYRVYDRLRRAQRFPALVPLRGSACGSCHGHFPPQVVREVTHHGTIHTCEACGVLVYADKQE